MQRRIDVDYACNGELDKHGTNASHLRNLLPGERGQDSIPMMLPWKYGSLLLAYEDLFLIPFRRT